MYISKNIRLRAPERTDIPRWVEWLNDPEVTEGLSMVNPMGLEDETRWFDDMIKQPIESHPMVIEIKEKNAWVMIGNCGFNQIDWRNANTELGIFIGDKRFWGKGVGTETMYLLLKVGFEVLNMHRIWLRVHEDNHRAIRCYEKVGFVHEGRYRDAEYRHGVYMDVMIMSVLRPDWKDDQNPGV